MQYYKNLAKNTGSPKKIEEEATKIWEAMYTNVKIPGLTYTRSKDNTTQKMSGKIELHNILISHPILKKESLCDAIWDRISVRDNLISERTRLAAELKIMTNQIKELVQDCNECEKAKESLQENIEKLEKQNEKNEEKTELFMKKNLELEAANRKDRQTVINLGSQMNNLIIELDTLENTLHKVKQLHEKTNQEQLAKIENLKKSNDKQKQTIEKLQNELKESNKKNKSEILAFRLTRLELKTCNVL
jgi:DNA repair exonuclease SbcCD ATPase subunit